jgi:two-component system, chemotaxis family, protein-glutamate methylesterase/glutaminase
MRNDLKADIIVIGASAGGVEALEQVVAGLQPNFPAALFVTLPLPARGVGRLPEILSRQGPLPASHPLDGTSVEKSHIYVATPDRHLFVQQDRIQLSAGPKENQARPAINAMFFGRPHLSMGLG